jgi:ABC-2 type transport system permease protein
VSRRAVSIVARWEYRRFAKPKDLVIGTLTFAVIFGIFGFVTEFVERKANEQLEIAVVSGELMGLEEVEFLQRYLLLPAEEGLADLERMLADEELDAILVVTDADQGELRVRSERGWQEEFLALLAAHRQTRRPYELGLDSEALAALTAPVSLTRVELETSGGGPKRAEGLTVIIVVGTMLLGLLLGFSYVFIAITGEKTDRVTESVLAAITPQQWIDGKILGLTLVTLVNVISYGVGYTLYKAAAVLIFGVELRLPPGVADPGVLAWLLLFALGGFAFWFTLFAMVAATISDPNTSSRSALMMLPFLPLGLTLVGMDQPDAFWMRVLAVVPGISPAAMPVRLLRGDPALLEILVSLALLAAAAWLFRSAAGRVFGVSMLMTGKEPSWTEVWRWIRAG